MQSTFIQYTSTIRVPALTCLSTFTMREARLILDSYTSLALDPCFPRIWSSLQEQSYEAQVIARQEGTHPLSGLRILYT
ncbi:hypothetical protein E2C01_020122 [Portunus trituberculatus]|uniref:Uncharacterized protein n=1 Tax=Portunus trituberculatus TaxID=210409 RepID=A0A5B7DZC3_PORTR|nr:hypothetical protein [Portunus trituberculatus]